MQSVQHKKSMYWISGIVAFLLVFPTVIFVPRIMDLYTEKSFVVQPSQSLISQIEQENKQSALSDNILNNTNDTKVRLIDSFLFIRPSSFELCETNNPWLLGEKTIQQDEFLNAKDCFAIRIKLQKNKRI